MADFLSENLPNQFLYRCLTANTSLPEETILAAFNEAYTICIDVLAEPDIHTSRSASFSEIARRASRSSLLAHCFVFFLLSFHEKAADLRRYLDNLRAMLEESLPDIFHPVLMAVSALAPLYPATVSFLPSSAAAISAQPALNDTKQYVKIQNLIHRAELLPNYEAEVVLRVVRGAVADESCDWDTILAMEIDRINKRPEHSHGLSVYHLREGQITTFVKILRTIWKLNIFLDDKDRYVTSFEGLAYAFCYFLNSKPKSSINNLLYEGKQVQEKTYMATFDKMKSSALAYYKGEDDLQDATYTGIKPNVQEYSQGKLQM